MSLINDMLKDLEQRNAKAGAAPISSDVRSVASSPTGSNRRLIWLSLAVVLIALGAYVAVLGIKPVPPAATSAAPVVSPPPSAPVAANTPAVDTPGGWEPPAEPASQPDAVPVAVAPSDHSMVYSLDRELRSTPQPETVQTTEADEKKTARLSRPLETAPPAPAGDTLETAEPKPSRSAARNLARTTGPLPLKQVSPEQRSENLYRQSVALIQQGRMSEAQSMLQRALEANAANHDARQLLVGSLVDSKRNGEAIELLRGGLAVDPKQSGFSMALARLLIEAGDRQSALSEMERGLPGAGDDAEYHAFFAALLQRDERHAEAMQHYLVALRSNPAMPNWLIGAGISMQAQNLPLDAAEAYQRALDTGQLTPELVQFAEQRLKQVRR